MRWRAVLLPVLLGLSSLGCNASRVLIASPGDYADYRRVRLADTADERMAAAYSYLKDRPDGRYADRLKRYFDKAEPAFYDVRRRSEAGLESYLRALPEGPHADEALATLMDLRVESRREAVDSRVARATGARLEMRKAAREDAAEVLPWWLTTLLDRELYEAPFDQGPSELVVRYRLALPAAVCGGHLQFPAGQHCVKPFVHAFEVLGDEGREERELAYEVEVELDNRWHLRRTTITGGGLFMLTEEASSGRTLGDLEDETIAETARAYLDALPKTLGEEDILCAGGPDASGIYRFDCEGIALLVEPGAGGGADRIVVTSALGIEAEAPEGDGDEADDGDAASDDDDDEADDDDDDDEADEG